MIDNDNKPDFSNLIAEFEELQDFVDNFRHAVGEIDQESRDDKLYRLAIDASRFNFSEILADLLKLDQTSHKSEITQETGEMLAELKSELETKDHKIHEFKLSLADTVIENKNLQKKNAELQENIGKLRHEISQMQLHSKELSLKLRTAEKNFHETRSEFEIASTELLELREKSYALKGRTADLEDQLKEYNQQILDLKDDNSSKSEEIKKLKALSEDLAESYELSRTKHDALEERSLELEATIDSLQKEKSLIKARLDKLLVGLPKNINHSQPTTSGMENSQLEPRGFTPYLPFCFPERVPNVIAFRREIKQSFGKTFPKNLPKPTPAFPHNFKYKFESANTRTFAFKPVFNCKTTKDFTQVIRAACLDDIDFLYKADLRVLVEDYFPDFFAKVLTSGSFKCLKILSRTNAGKALRRIEMSEKPEFGIHTHSLDLLLSYLTRTIIEANYQELKHSQPLVEQLMTTPISEHEIKTANIFNEKLAFRYGYQLKSHKLNLHRVNFAQSFRRGAGLKSVLETFGNTINSMVQKFDVFSSPKPEKTAKK